jgi:hypothetical protein
MRTNCAPNAHRVRTNISNTAYTTHRYLQTAKNKKNRIKKRATITVAL